MEKINLTTSDGVSLSALFWDAKGLVSVLLLHMMPATKESWSDLANRLFHRGVNVLAIDFRGHGQSAGGSYKSFSDEEHQKYLIDATTALEFLKQRYPKAEIELAGASIGANIVLQLMSNDVNYKVGVVLSPGLDYHGTQAGEYIKKLNQEQKVLVIGSKDDGDNAEQVSELKQINDKLEIMIVDSGGHGTDILKNNHELLNQVVDFLL